MHNHLNIAKFFCSALCMICAELSRNTTTERSKEELKCKGSSCAGGEERGLSVQETEQGGLELDTVDSFKAGFVNDRTLKTHH